MKSAIFAALVAGAGCASAVHVAAYATEGLAIASLGCDAVSTHVSLAGHPTRIEMNDSVLGQHPTIETESLYFGGIAGGVVAFNQGIQLGETHRQVKSERATIIGEVWRIAANLVILAVEVDSVENNQRYASGCGL